MSAGHAYAGGTNCSAPPLVVFLYPYCSQDTDNVWPMAGRAWYDFEVSISLPEALTCNAAGDRIRLC